MQLNMIKSVFKLSTFLKYTKQMYTDTWNNKKNAIVNVNSNIKTIQKLEQLGYIKVIEICDNRSNIVIDTIQVLNY